MRKHSYLLTLALLAIFSVAALTPLRKCTNIRLRIGEFSLDDTR